MAIEHTANIYWPNGNGHTPCSVEYLAVMNERDAIHKADNGESLNLDDLSPEYYQRWSELDDKLNSMQLSGHLGKSVRY